MISDITKVQTILNELEIVTNEGIVIDENGVSFSFDFSPYDEFGKNKNNALISALEEYSRFDLDTYIETYPLDINKTFTITVSNKKVSVDSFTKNRFLLDYIQSIFQRLFQELNII